MYKFLYLKENSKDQNKNRKVSLKKKCISSYLEASHAKGMAPRNLCKETRDSLKYQFNLRPVISRLHTRDRQFPIISFFNLIPKSYSKTFHLLSLLYNLILYTFINIFIYSIHLLLRHNNGL